MDYFHWSKTVFSEQRCTFHCYNDHSWEVVNNRGEDTPPAWVTSLFSFISHALLPLNPTTTIGKHSSTYSMLIFCLFDCNSESLIRKCLLLDSTAQERQTNWRISSRKVCHAHRYKPMYKKMYVYAAGSGKWSRCGSTWNVCSLRWPAEGDSNGCLSISDEVYEKMTSHLTYNI